MSSKSSDFTAYSSCGSTSVDSNTYSFISLIPTIVWGSMEGFQVLILIGRLVFIMKTARISTEI